MTTTLESHGISFLTAATGREALAEASRANPDVILLDLGLPDMDGVEIIRAVRQWSMLPIIVLSARTEDDDKVAALDAGADDYLTKPFSVDELLARLRAALRRVRYERGHMGRNESSFENGDLRIDFAAGCVSVAGQQVHLAPMEYKLLCLLANQCGQGAYAQNNPAGRLGQCPAAVASFIARVHGNTAQKTGGRLAAM